MKRTFVASACLLLAGTAGSANAQTSSTCLVVDNAWYPETKVVSVLVDGYGQHYWSIPNSTTVTLTDRDGPTLRGASFTISIYEGDAGSTGSFIESTTSGNPSTHVLWTFVTPKNMDGREQPECRDNGYWLALIHG